LKEKVMPKIEILVYSPIDMDKFVDFCIKGKPTGPTTFEVDELGREIRGVMKWLHGRGVEKAQFFHTPKGHPISLFTALVQKRDDEPQDRPWFRTIKTSPPKLILDPDIAGVDKQLRVDGQLGVLEDFLPMDKLLAGVEHKPELDAEFDAGREMVLKVLNQLEKDPTRKQKFLAALRSDRESNPTKVFAEINKEFNTSF
jgi:hypothetical protein